MRYDPLLAKVIAHAEDRDACIERMAAALAETSVLGVQTNLGFLRGCSTSPASAPAAPDRLRRAGVPRRPPPPLPDDVRAAALAAGRDDVWHAFGPPRPQVEVADGHVLHGGWQYRVTADEGDAWAGRGGGRSAARADAGHRAAGGRTRGRGRGRRRASGGLRR